MLRYLTPPLGSRKEGQEVKILQNSLSVACLSERPPMDGDLPTPQGVTYIPPFPIGVMNYCTL